ncbi:hypothetical protein JSQ81_08675 [Sporosarcina sp. Marseille-Q4063]|uniref:hypothetical protein n=1 Tax=Sporosarcina sp. Marseille-Q4063 TaxID=2810514 RepID=UPI001BAFB93D|nr:hypothetical protein [Sporosarcina sp. Marseille-Q4063]QUW23559.1 hypothetical protein JSQ81_08675 [Sporosarcina sp. Marseille-Q4063]
MKSKIWIPVLFLAIIIGGVYLFLKFNPPLEVGTLASTEDKKSVVVGAGNKGFRDIKILDVKVNNGDKPMKTRLQVSNALQGFIITNDDTEEKASKFGFTDIGKVAIKTGTSPSSNFEKLDNGTATKNDEIYGISVFHNEEVNKVYIKYNYLGISFNETVILN